MWRAIRVGLTAPYDGLIGSHKAALDGFLAGRPETAGLEEAKRRGLGAAFLDQLIGTDCFRALLGLSGVSAAVRKDRAERAADTLVAALSPT